ncbi:MAG TPA: protease pro-enzyme activation domain-containing protein [Bryobacteraceae bacterium]|nr:protease pro-enzyme activation domain-containing protein [Bryobacteraceae bacterium]
MRSAFIGLFCSVVAANVCAQPSGERVRLAGHIHPKARPEFDQGRLEPSWPLTHLTLELAPSAAQKADLERLLVRQQTPGSPEYHHWLTPEQYAQRFGASDAEIAQLSAWLQSQGLKVTSVARGRNWIAFDGSAAEVESAFQTELNRYRVAGELHFANATAPSIPAGFSGRVGAIRGLHDFRAKPRARGRIIPDYTSGRTGVHYVVPDDVATIYDIGPLYSAGVNGAGQSIAVAGQSQIVLSNIQLFRSAYGLPPSTPQTVLVPGSANPGVISGDADESHLDVEWAGAVARNASIIFVYSTDVMQSIQYAIDQALAPVLTSSYGECEPETFTADAEAMRNWAQQANAEGITWFAASGDNGAEDCNNSQHPGLAVDLPASIPEVTGVGGTEFSEGSGNYWNANNTATGASALSYIPEVAWNDPTGCSGGAAASGGGKSILWTKPSWQTGTGVPADGARDVPDVAINASCAHDAYLFYTGGALQGSGGTSFGAPIFAGIAALLNQYLTSSGAQASGGLGNINPRLYWLAQASSGAFHDITSGNNILAAAACPPFNRGTCTPSSSGGYTAGVGYDQVTGLGSVDVAELVNAWTGASNGPPTSEVSVNLVSSESSAALSDTVFLIATVTGANGSTPAGAVEFAAGSTVLGSAPLVGSAGVATATLAVSGSQLAPGGTISASYSGSSASVGVSVSASGGGSGGKPSISGVANAASFRQAFAPGELISIFGTQLAGTTELDSALPLPETMSGVAATINGEAAPLLYVSPGQVNLQIPYEVPVGSNATVTLNNNGQVASQSISIAAAAPGIFFANGAVDAVDANGAVVSSAKSGQVISIFITGAGAVSPAIATGAAPSSQTAVANLPNPAQTTTVSIGNVNAPIQFAGIAPGLVGVLQINIQVPTGVALGAQPVVVTIGGVSSAPATLTITN